FTLVVLWIAPGWTHRLIDLPTRAMRLFGFRVSLVSLVSSLAVYWILGIILRKVWLARRELDTADTSVVIGCIGGLAVLMIPVFEGTWAMRFQLMTPVPGAILLAFGVSRLSEGATDRRLKWLATAAAVLAVVAPFFMQGPVLTQAAAAELKSLRQQIEKPTETLVVAEHGVEFWAGLILHTHARSGSIPDELDPYSNVVLLVSKRDRDGRERPRMRDHEQGPRSQHDRPPRRATELTISADARLIHDGTYFRLLEIN
ncbi:MAG: hypothetical protein KDB23_13135, partial [Planctomycetales bacterium]|nr:hypothetical protein [Planctomycetales bacterium]